MWCQFLFKATVICFNMTRERERKKKNSLFFKKGNLKCEFLLNLYFIKGYRTPDQRSKDLVWTILSWHITHCEFPVREEGGSLPCLCFFPRLLMYFQRFPFNNYLIPLSFLTYFLFNTLTGMWCTWDQSTEWDVRRFSWSQNVQPARQTVVFSVPERRGKR